MSPGPRALRCPRRAGISARDPQQTWSPAPRTSPPWALVSPAWLRFLRGVRSLCPQLLCGPKVPPYCTPGLHERLHVAPRASPWLVGVRVPGGRARRVLFKTMGKGFPLRSEGPVLWSFITHTTRPAHWDPPSPSVTGPPCSTRRLQGGRALPFSFRVERAGFAPGSLPARGHLESQGPAAPLRPGAWPLPSSPDGPGRQKLQGQAQPQPGARAGTAQQARAGMPCRGRGSWCRPRTGIVGGGQGPGPSCLPGPDLLSE